MRVRIVVAGILAGVICLVFLWFQYYWIRPSAIVPDWPGAVDAAAFPSWTSTAILIICALTLFTFGWVAARWNWAENWRTSLLCGGGMGLIAGCVIYDFIGVFWFSLEAQAEILRNFYLPLTEEEGLRILLEAVVKTGSFLYMNFVGVVLACMALGAFGGLASAFVDVRDFWGQSPRKPQGWLFRLCAYILTISGYLNLIVTVAALTVLSESTSKSALQSMQEYAVQWNNNYPAGLLLFLGALLGLIFTFLPAGITWGWIIRTWMVRGKPSVLATLWIVITTFAISSFFLNYLRLVSFISPRWDLISLLGAFLGGILIGAMTEDDSEGFPYHLSDWVGYGLTYAILGGTQIVMGVLAYALAVTLITITNIPHLMGLGVVEQAPVDQVMILSNMQSASASVAILASLLIGLIVAFIISFVRTLIDTKDVSLQRD